MLIDPEKGTVILAAHGSRREPVANAIVCEHARRLQEEYGCQTVRAAFRQGTPAFGEVLDTISVDEVTVVPFFAADGYYARIVLPRELSLNQRYPHVRVRFTEAVGTHPGIPPLVDQRVRQLLRQFHLKAEQTALIVVGHGTSRHASSSASTRTLVEKLRKLGVCSEVHPAFLDEPPQLEEVFGALSRPQVVVFPFFMGGSYHVLRDLPGRLGMENLAGAQFPAQATRAGQQVVFDRAIGSDEGMTSIIAELAAQGGSVQE
jgi:sirohydrochlorin cobaltochelatase